VSIPRRSTRGTACGAELAAERQAKFLQEIRRRRAATVADLVELFGVSDMTIRRIWTSLPSRVRDTRWERSAARTPRPCREAPPVVEFGERIGTRVRAMDQALELPAGD
jgi:hypothetical protein